MTTAMTSGASPGGDSAHLPAGRHVVVTQSISTTMTGMTHAFLNRTIALIEHFDIDVEILLLDQRRDLATTVAWLESRGLTHPRMTFTSLWDDVADGDIDLSAAFGPRSWRRDLLMIDVRHRVGKVRRAPRSSAAWRGLFRTALTTISSAKRPLARGEVKKLGRRTLPQPHLLAVSDAAGRHLGVTQGWWSLWSTWLTQRLAQGEPVHLICDNWHVVDLLTQWGLPHVATTYVVHSDHIGSRTGDLHGEGWTQGRGFALQRAAALDACVFLTDQQRERFVADHGDPGNLHVVPNSIALPDAPRGDRDPRRGVAMTRLVAIKRPKHAVQALRMIADPTVEFDLFGGTEHRDQWDDLVELIGEDDRIRLCGRTDDPIGEFAKASFTLVTSTSEGFGLSIIEAMSVGCIPICYDIRYGPGELITHGVDGFVVAPEPAALAAAIEQFLALPEDAVATMRAAARARAADFSHAAVVRRWPAVLTAAARRRQQRDAPAPDRESLFEVEVAARRWHAS